MPTEHTHISPARSAFWIFDFNAISKSLSAIPLSRTYMQSTTRPGVVYPWACFANNSTYPAEVSLIDMTNTANPTVYSNVYTSPGSIHAITMDSNYLYVAINDGSKEKLAILDYKSNPSAPVLKSDTWTFTSQVQSIDTQLMSQGKPFWLLQGTVRRATWWM